MWWGRAQLGPLIPVLAWDGGSMDDFFMGKSIPGGITSPFHRHEPWEGGSPLPGWPLMPVATVI